MASMVIALGPDEFMATSTSATREIIGAIKDAQLATEKQISEVNITVAGLRSDVGHLGDALRDLATKVERIDDQKAARGELDALQHRVDKRMDQIVAQSAVDLGRMDHDKIGHSDLSLDAFDSMAKRVNEIEKQTEKIDGLVAGQKAMADRLEELSAFRWRIVGAYTAVATVFGLGGWIIGHLWK
jgi:uncharacterized coiled-coil protein SlyX